MVHPYPDDSRHYSGPPRRCYPPHDDRDGHMYDDRSRTRSPGDMDYEGRSRSPQQHPADRRLDYSRDQDAQYRSRDRDDYRNRTSRSPPRRGRQSYRDRDREGYQSPGYSHSRSRSPRGGKSHFGQESREVMMDGIPQDMTEDDVSAELRDAYHLGGLEDVRVIRDRHTKISRGLGFLRFGSLKESRDFLERNHPYIYFYGPTAGNDDRATKVRIAYSREREDRARAKAEGDWTCRMCAVVNFATRPKCFRCNAPRPEIPMAPVGPPGVPLPKVANNGDNDAAPENQPSQFLLFRGLDSSVSEDLFAKGAAKLYRPNSSSNDNASNNPKKGAKVASTTGDSNLGAREGSIRRVLLVRDRKTNESWHYGFVEFANVMDAQAAIQRLNSFVKFTISSKPVMVSYIHAGVFVPVMNPNSHTERFTFSPLNNPSAKLMYWDDEGYVTELVVSSGDDGTQIDQQDCQARGSKESEKSKKRKAETTASAAAKKTAMPAQLQFWSNRHAELHGIPKDSDGNPLDDQQGDSTLDSGAPPTQSYADVQRNACYLCLRQFKSTANVHKHERLSELHQMNLQNEALVARGMAKLIKHGIIPPTAEYRDRARERRKAFGPDKAKTHAPKAVAPKKQEEAPLQTTSKGASLLSKMGWSEGSGLGAQGTGVTAPIATEVYAQGVGLGAQGSKIGDAVEEAARNTRGRYDEFLEKTRANARQRFDRMGE